MSSGGFWSVEGKYTDPVLSAYEQAGFNIEVMHIATGKACVFPAWLTAFSDSFTSTWNTQNVFGRPDPIGAWNGTQRRISISLSIPSFTPEEGYANMHQLEHLMGFMYPSYKQKGDSNIMNAYPLVKMKFANFVKDARVEQNAVSVLKGGLAGWLETVDFTPNLEAGFHHMAPDFTPNQVKGYNRQNDRHQRKTTNKSHTFIPKVFDVNISYAVVHEHSLGWTEDKKWLGNYTDKDGKKPKVGAGFPYGYESQGGQLHDLTRNNGSSINSPLNRIREGNNNVRVNTGGAGQNSKKRKNSQKNRSAARQIIKDTNGDKRPNKP